MSGGTTMTTQPTPKGAWKITFLLFLFMLVNFADKIVVGLAGVPIMTELQLEPEQFGLLGSAFFFLYSIAAIVVGFIVNRVATRWVLLVLAAIWEPVRVEKAAHVANSACEHPGTQNQFPPLNPAHPSPSVNPK